MNQPVARTGARMLILGPDDRVLLIEEAWSEGPGAPWRHWLTPGGGVEAGESLPLAATREVLEETGLRIQLPADAAPVLVHRRQWSWGTSSTTRPTTTSPRGLPARSWRYRPPPPRWRPRPWWARAGGAWPSCARHRRCSCHRRSPTSWPNSSPETRWPGRRSERPAGCWCSGRPGGCCYCIPDRRRDRNAPTGSCPAAGSRRMNPCSTRPRGSCWRRPASSRRSRPTRPWPRWERAVFQIGDWHLDQTDHYFVHRVGAEVTGLDRSRWTQLEQETVLGWRWWSAGELRATAERFWPADLPSILDRERQRPG